MLSRIKFYVVRTLQILWLSLATVLVWLFYILPLYVIFRDLVWEGWFEYGIAEFTLAEKGLEKWHVRLWRDWQGWAGPMVLIRRSSMEPDAVNRTRKHELRHCWQQFILGIFHYLAYAIESLYIWFWCKHLHAYLDNYFERDARRAAGQLVDVPRSMWPHGPNDCWPWW